MIAKEKAKELFNKYRLADLHIKDSSFITKLLAKQCALICVDEMLLEGATQYGIYAVDYGREKFLQEVKEEIEKL